MYASVLELGQAHRITLPGDPMRSVVYFLAIVVVSACQRGPAAAQGPVPESEGKPWVTLHSGARVRAQLANRQVIGPLMVPFTPDSQHIVICESQQAPCVGLDDPGTVGCRWTPPGACRCGASNPASAPTLGSTPEPWRVASCMGCPARAGWGFYWVASWEARSAGRSAPE